MPQKKHDLVCMNREEQYDLLFFSSVFFLQIKTNKKYYIKNDG